MRLAALLISATLFNAAAQDDTAPKQPIPFNHKLHVTALKQPCKMCHPNANPGEMMGLPEASNCIGCHSAIAPKDTGERKLLAYSKQNRDLDWVRVYQIPTFVRFDHRQHLQAGAKCETCHGPVAERTALWQEKPLSMGACMDCHRTTHASLDCGSCHEPR